MALARWDAALKLARVLARHHAGDGDVSAVIEQAAANSLRAAPDDAARRAVWKGLKPRERTLPEVALAVAEVFADAPALVSKPLKDALDERLEPRLLTAYAQCSVEEVRPRLQRAEVWLRANPQHPELLRVLGSLCLRGQLWGPATAYLERSLQQRDDPRTHALLGSLFDRLDRPQDASRHWRLATAAVVGLTVLDRDGALPAADTQSDPQRLDVEVADYEGEPYAGAAPPRLAPAAPDGAIEDYELGLADLPPRDPAVPQPATPPAAEPGKS